MGDDPYFRVVRVLTSAVGLPQRLVYAICTLSAKKLIFFTHVPDRNSIHPVNSDPHLDYTIAVSTLHTQVISVSVAITGEHRCEIYRSDVKPSRICLLGVQSDVPRLKTFYLVSSVNCDHSEYLKHLDSPGLVLDQLLQYTVRMS
jgi:hypothetical protein